MAAGTEFLLQRDGDNLVAVDGPTLQAIRNMRQYEIVRAPIKRMRNPKHHRLAYKLFDTVFQNQTIYPTLNRLVDAIKIGTGLYDTYTDLHQRQVYVPRSISYSAMDQAEFSQWWDAVFKFVCEYILPGVDDAALRSEIEAMVGIRDNSERR